MIPAATPSDMLTAFDAWCVTLPPAKARLVREAYSAARKVTDTKTAVRTVYEMFGR